MDQVDIRLYDDADLEPVACLFTDAVHALAAGSYDATQRAAWAPRPPPLPYWRERLSSLTTLLAERDGELAGFISYEPDGHIDLLFTAPAHARRRVASLLYARAEATLLAAGITALYTEASIAARPFFERQGFCVTEEQEFVVRGASLRRFAMRKCVDGHGERSPGFNAGARESNLSGRPPQSKD